MSPRFLCSVHLHSYNRSFPSCCQHKHSDAFRSSFASLCLCTLYDFYVFVYVLLFLSSFGLSLFHPLPQLVLLRPLLLLLLILSGNPSCTSPFQVQPCVVYFKLEIFNLGSINCKPLFSVSSVSSFKRFRCVAATMTTSSPFPNFLYSSTSGNTQRNRLRLDQ